jgi:hypothetical protein
MRFILIDKPKKSQESEKQPIGAEDVIKDRNGVSHTCNTEDRERSCALKAVSEMSEEHRLAEREAERTIGIFDTKKLRVYYCVGDCDCVDFVGSGASCYVKNEHVIEFIGASNVDDVFDRDVECLCFDLKHWMTSIQCIGFYHCKEPYGDDDQIEKHILNVFSEEKGFKSNKEFISAMMGLLCFERRCLCCVGIDDIVDITKSLVMFLVGKKGEL